MRIVSQRRDVSVDFDKVIIKIDGEKFLCAVSYSDFVRKIRLGAYDTPERAREVFKDIHNAYAPVGIITTNLTEEQTKAFIGSVNLHVPVIQMNEPNTGITTYNEVVYYMPSK